MSKNLPYLTNSDVVIAAEKFGDDLVKRGMRQARAAATMKACDRCQGKGIGWWAGTSAPGDCFKCGGSGQIVAKKADRDDLDRLRAQIEVERLRVLYRGYKMALSMLLGGMTATVRPFEVDMVARNYEKKLVSLVNSGKAAAVRAA